MLFGYPAIAIEENWLHESIISMLEIAEERIQLGAAIPVWGNIIPVAYRPQLIAKRTFRDNFYNFVDAISGLVNDAEKARVFKAIRDQNNIETLLSGISDCECLDDLPEIVRAPATELFTSAFKLLTTLEIRDVQYKIIFDYISDKVCPFCGIEFFDAPGAPREDLDHYLMINKYVFAGANLSNLVPMGDKCNQGYKKTNDMIRRNDGSRRRAFYPYNPVNISVTLNNSEILANGKSHDWQVEFSVACEEIDTWDAVFNIKNRYKRDVLDLKFDRWIRFFRNWVRENDLELNLDKDILIEKINSYIVVLTTQELSGIDRLRLPVFQMLANHCKTDNQKVIRFLIDSILF